jgi:hypothetical protein
LCDFGGQADAVFNRAAIIIVTEIGITAQELVEQIAIGAVDLHAVKSRRHRILQQHLHNRR